MDLGTLIKQEIKKQKRTQKEVAAEIEISETALSQIVRNVFFPSNSTIVKLCAALKVKLQFSFTPVE